jgi:hypothetical protein
MNGLNDIQINKLLKRVPSFHGCYPKDQLPNPLKKGRYIVNMQNHNKGNGTHWVAFRYDYPYCEHFDSFGFLPSTQIEKACNSGAGKASLLHNAKQIQDYNSSACGWFCVACILYDGNKHSKIHFNRFISRFSDDTHMNDEILFHLIKALKG